MHGPTAISTFFVVLLGAVVVRAAPPSEDPEALIRIGNELRRKGDQERAVGYFRRAYELAHTPRSAAQLGLAELAVDRFVAAETHLSEALRTDDPWVDEHVKALQASRVTARQHLLGVELVGAPRDATIVLGDGTLVPLPADGTLWLTPGPAALKVQAIGHEDAAIQVTGAAGEHHKIQLSMPALVDLAAPAPPKAPEPAPGVPEPMTAPTAPPATDTGAQPSAPMNKLKVAGIVVASVGVVAGVVGGVAFAAGSARESRFNDLKQPYSEDDANWKSLKYPGLGLLVGGGVAVATGAVLFVVGGKTSKPEEHALSIDVGPGTGLLRWKGAF